MQLSNLLGVVCVALLPFSYHYQNQWLKFTTLAAGATSTGNALYQKRREAQQTLEERYQAAEAQLEQERQQAIAEVQEFVSRETELMDLERNHYQIQIANLQAQLSEFQLPKRPPGGGYAEWLADQMQMVLWDFGIQLDYQDAKQIGGQVYCWYLPKMRYKLPKIREAIAEMTGYVDGLTEKPAITVEGGVVQLRATFSEAKLKQDQNKSLTVEGFEYFEEAIQASVHDRVCGQTGSGKSTLVANLLDYATQYLGAKTPILIDPKYPDSEWRVNGEIFLPQYRGFEPWIAPDGTEYPDAIAGLRVMSEDLKARQEAAMLSVWEGKEPERKPVIYAIDEAEQLIADYKQIAADPMLYAARIGRSAKVRCIMIGQNGGAKAYKMEKAHLKNFTQWFLGEAIIQGIDFVARTTIEKNRLKKELSQLEKIALTDEQKQYFALIKQPSKPAFFAYLPPPNYFCDPFTEVDSPHPQTTSYPVLDNSQSLLQQRLSDTDQLLSAVEDAEILEEIDHWHSQGVTKLTEIIPKVFHVQIGSRAYRKAREKYRRLTGV